MKYIQLTLGLLVVFLCFSLCFVLQFTTMIQMESWRSNVLSAVLVGYGLFRGWRVYKAFKANEIS